MSEVKKSKKADIIKVIVAILAVLMGTYIFVEPGKDTYSPNSSVISKIDSLQKANDTLQESNIKLDSIIANYDSIIHILDSRLAFISKQRIKAADRVSEEPVDVDTFFMNRYNYE
jgi:hypothetical protein